MHVKWQSLKLFVNVTEMIVILQMCILKQMKRKKCGQNHGNVYHNTFLALKGEIKLLQFE